VHRDGLAGDEQLLGDLAVAAPLGDQLDEGALAGPGLAQTVPLTAEEAQLIRDISAHNTAIRTMAGRFLQVDSNGGRIEGTFFLERPDKVRFRYNPPSREEIVSVGRGFYVLNRQDRTYYAYPQDTIPLRQFLGDGFWATRRRPR
jgi:hypothetical protein